MVTAVATQGRDGGGPGAGGPGAGAPARGTKRAPVLRVYQGGESTSPTDLLARITQGDREERLAAAKALEGIRSKRSFAPLLAAAEREQDKEVKVALLTALNDLSNCGDFQKPPDTVERLEALLFAETDRDVLQVANLTLYFFTPGGTKLAADQYFHELLGRAAAQLGVEHPVTRSIQSMIGYAIAADLF